MASKPYVIRWRDAVMDDPELSSRAKVAAMPLVRHADVTTGRNCYPGAALCAREMSVSIDTIERGWADLQEAGWLRIEPLAKRYRKQRGALKILLFRQPAESGMSNADNPLSAPLQPAESGATVPGNGKPSGRPSGRPGKPPCRKHPEERQYLDDQGEWQCMGCEEDEYWAGQR
jgi:hypothetical protein